MRWQVTNLDIDGSIPAQHRLSSFVDRHINLTQYEHELRLWPSKVGLNVVRNTLSTLETDCRHMVFYGTGDLNHLSSLLLERLPAAAKPVTLVLFDNHPDWFCLPPSYHCGNWVGTALRAPWLEQAILIGQDSEDLKGHNFWFSPWDDINTGRVRIHPYRTDSASVPFRGNLRFESLTMGGVTALAKRLRKELAGKNVYLAIDKDVLCLDDAHTDWEQGRMTISQMLTLIAAIAGSAKIVGADVCGEMSPEPLRGFAKRFDAGRLFRSESKDFTAATKINQRTNLALMDAIAGRGALALTGGHACCC